MLKFFAALWGLLMALRRHPVSRADETEHLHPDSPDAAPVVKKPKRDVVDMLKGEG